MLHVLSEAQGVPLVVGTSGADTNDSLALKPLVTGIPAVRSRRGPRRKHPAKLRADKAYHSADILSWLRERDIVARIARPGIESSERFGRHRWEIERSPGCSATAASPSGTNEKAATPRAFLGLAAALTCYKKRAELTT
ncbi:transposase [Streptomyces viridochromogenes]|uniref:transposase n=1 Tax=Streptomyces viridochromogenes TaxID=1938 RepID=UPI00099C1E32|nr:transposase [Streptomyces viridochromogenes]